MSGWWVLWFVISLPNGQIVHVPVEEQFADQRACESHLLEWETLIASQFPDDPARVYCKEFTPMTGEEI